MSACCCNTAFYALAVSLSVPTLLALRCASSTCLLVLQLGCTDMVCLLPQLQGVCQNTDGVAGAFSSTDACTELIRANAREIALAVMTDVCWVADFWMHPWMDLGPVRLELTLWIDVTWRLWQTEGRLGASVRWYYGLSRQHDVCCCMLCH